MIKGRDSSLLSFSEIVFQNNCKKITILLTKNYNRYIMKWVIKMIKSFSVRNYKSFKDEIVFDFGDIKDYKFNSHVIQNNLLNSAIIYGKNASGKSNLGLALFDITIHLIDKEQIPMQYSDYLNGNSDEPYAYFSYSFILDGNNIKYNYRKSEAAKLVYEELYVNQAKVFSYNFETHKKDLANLSLIDAETLNFDFRDMNISVVRYIANNTYLKKDSIIKKLVTFVGNMLWFRSIQNFSYIGFFKGSEIITENIIKNGLVTSFKKFLLDIGIDLPLDIATDPMGQKILINKFKNRIVPFWQSASSGTQALTLYFYWSHKFSEVSFLFVDEFDAFYHTELAEKIIEHVSKQTAFQSVFTTHNTALMSNQLLRPDCYMVLSSNKLTPLFKCTEKELREGHNLEKMYRQGEFLE